MAQTADAAEMAEWSARCNELRWALNRLCADVLESGSERTRRLLREYLDIHRDLANKLHESMTAEVPAR